MNTVAVFTWKNLEKMFEQGGCGDWVANEDRLSKCTYLVATANAYARESQHSPQKHCYAFLLGKISGTKEAPENPGRIIIQFDKYSEINIPDGWAGHRNPVSYCELSEFGIDPERIEWKTFPTDREKHYDLTPELTIQEAKRGIAKKLRIAPECIEITIRA